MQKKSQFIFNKTYFFIIILLLLAEMYIAKYIHGGFIRSYFGDYLVVILIYSFVKSFWRETYFRVAIYVLIFSFVVEVLQYFKIVEILGLGKIEWARIIIGTDFAWADLVAYFLGILTVIVVEYGLNKRRRVS